MGKQGIATVTPINRGKKAGATKRGEALLLSNGKVAANADAMRRAAVVYGISVPADASVAVILHALRAYLKPLLAKTKDADKVRCEDCGEIATQQTDYCPFCGADGDVDEVADADADAAAAAASPAKGGKTDAALAKLSSELDDHVSRINSLCGNLATNSYDLGVEIRAILEKELWKARGHESFKVFVEKELPIKRSLAYALANTVKKFDRDAFVKIGSKKLSLIASIENEEDRQRALDAAQAGASTRELQRTKAEGGKESAPARESKDRTPSKKEGGGITLLAKVNGKAATYPWLSLRSGRPLKEHGDDSYVEVKISEEVVQRVALKVTKDGTIVGLTVTFARAE